MRRGIYISANGKSEKLCRNLIYSIRANGCRLPIILIPFGGEPVSARDILDEVEVMEIERFPHGVEFISKLVPELSDCPLGFLYRFLGFLGPFEEFLYSDNDVVALMNWEELFYYLPSYNIVHADREYLTRGRYNCRDTTAIERDFGLQAFDAAFTAGHFLSIRSEEMIVDILSGLAWLRENRASMYNHDQALLLVAALVGKWRLLNLCKMPYAWRSTWSGDYASVFELFCRRDTNGNGAISHIHFSGGQNTLVHPLRELLWVYATPGSREKALKAEWISEILQIGKMRRFTKAALTRCLGRLG